MKEDWHGRGRRDDLTRGETRRDREERGMRSGPLRDEERWRRRSDEVRESGAWVADELHRSRGPGGADDLRGSVAGRDLARRIRDIGSFDPYENAPRFRERSGQEDWPGGRRGGGEIGRFRGRGPRGYKRLDTRIEEDVNDRLTEDPWLDASEIEVSVSNGEVTLGGFVSSRQDKRRAEDCADGVSGVLHVQNNLRMTPVEA